MELIEPVIRDIKNILYSVFDGSSINSNSKMYVWDISTNSWKPYKYITDLNSYTETSKIDVASTSGIYQLNMTKGTSREPIEVYIYKNDYPGATGSGDGCKIEFFWTNNPTSPSSSDKIGEIYLDTASVFIKDFREDDLANKSLVIKASQTGTYLFSVRYYYK